jgi:hypothetical protein
MYAMMLLCRAIGNGKPLEAITFTHHHHRHNRSISTQGALFLALLAVQFGLQPVLFREFSPRTLNKKSIVLV